MFPLANARIIDTIAGLRVGGAAASRARRPPHHRRALAARGRSLRPLPAPGRLVPSPRPFALVQPASSPGGFSDSKYLLSLPPSKLCAVCPSRSCVCPSRSCASPSPPTPPPRPPTRQWSSPTSPSPLPPSSSRASPTNSVDAACSLNERTPPAHASCRHAADLVAADAAALAAITSFIARLLLLRSFLLRCVPLMVLPLWLMRMAMTAVQQRAGSRPPSLVPPRPGRRLVCCWQHPPRVPRRGRMEDRCDRGSSNPCTARVVLLATANGLTASLLVFT